MWLFFFFKQKTAYEMRIRDWRSDVCSSDLLLRGGAVASRDRRAPGGPLPQRHPRPRPRGPRAEPGGEGLVRGAAGPRDARGSEERRGGQECVSSIRSRGAPDHKKNKNHGQNDMAKSAKYHGHNDP